MEIKIKIPKNGDEYYREVRKLERKGFTTSDAQGYIDVILRKNKIDAMTLELLPDQTYTLKELLIRAEANIGKKAVAKQLAMDKDWLIRGMVELENGKYIDFDFYTLNKGEICPTKE